VCFFQEEPDCSSNTDFTFLLCVTIESCECNSDTVFFVMLRHLPNNIFPLCDIIGSYIPEMSVVCLY
jgi:hypothetical protein